MFTDRAVYEESSKDDDPQQDWTGGLDHLEVAVLVCEQDDHGEAADDDALEDEEDGPEDHVQGDDARGAVHAVLATFGTHQALKPCVGTTDPGPIQLKQKKFMTF